MQKGGCERLMVAVVAVGLLTGYLRPVTGADTGSSSPENATAQNQAAHLDLTGTPVPGGAALPILEPVVPDAYSGRRRAVYSTASSANHAQHRLGRAPAGARLAQARNHLG